MLEDRDERIQRLYRMTNGITFMPTVPIAPSVPQAQQTQSQAAPAPVEYKIVETYLYLLEPQLNELGAAGWILVSIMAAETPVRYVFYRHKN